MPEVKGAHVVEPTSQDRAEVGIELKFVFKTLALWRLANHDSTNLRFLPIGLEAFGTGGAPSGRPTRVNGTYISSSDHDSGAKYLILQEHRDKIFLSRERE